MALSTVDLDVREASKMNKAMLTSTLQNATATTEFACTITAAQAIHLIHVLNSEMDMPDMAILFVKAKVQDTNDPAVLQTIIRAKPSTIGPKQAKEWEEVVGTACERIFRMADTRSDIPVSSVVPLDVLERMVLGSVECEWVQEDLPLPTQAHGCSLSRGENMSVHPRELHQALNTVNIVFNDEKQVLLTVCGSKCAFLEKASVTVITGTRSYIYIYTYPAYDLRRSVTNRLPVRIPPAALASTLANGSSDAGQHPQTVVPAVEAAPAVQGSCMLLFKGKGKAACKCVAARSIQILCQLWPYPPCRHADGGHEYVLCKSGRQVRC